MSGKSLVHMNKGISDLLCAFTQLLNVTRDRKHHTVKLTNQQIDNIDKSEVRFVDRKLASLRSQQAYFVLHRMLRVLKRIENDLKDMRARLLVQRMMHRMG